MPVRCVVWSRRWHGVLDEGETELATYRLETKFFTMQLIFGGRGGRTCSSPLRKFG
jgi:hypothetical protein